jgi:type II secretory pathway pseudopilin PulG
MGHRADSANDSNGRRGQEGYLMAALAAAVAVMVIFGTLAFQAWVDVLRRDNEAEMIFRAKDLVRAIQRYRRDHGGVAPQKLEDLMEPGQKGQYYLRKLWKDPLVPDGKWGLVYVGPGGQIIDPNAPEQQSGPGAGSGLGIRGGGSIFDRDEGEGNQSGGTGRSTGQFGGQAARGQGQQQQQQFRTLSSDDSGADPNAGGKQIAGLPIAGVRSLCEDDPFRVYNGLTEYREWLFTYLDLEQPQLPGRGRQPGAQPPGAGQRRPGLGRPGPGRPGSRPNQSGPGRNRGPGRR